MAKKEDLPVIHVIKAIDNDKQNKPNKKKKKNQNNKKNKQEGGNARSLLSSNSLLFQSSPSSSTSRSTSAKSSPLPQSSASLTTSSSPSPTNNKSESPMRSLSKKNNSAKDPMLSQIPENVTIRKIQNNNTNIFFETEKEKEAKQKNSALRKDPKKNRFLNVTRKVGSHVWHHLPQYATATATAYGVHKYMKNKRENKQALEEKLSDFLKNQNIDPTTPLAKLPNNIQSAFFKELQTPMANSPFVTGSIIKPVAKTIRKKFGRTVGNDFERALNNLVALSQEIKLNDELQKVNIINYFRKVTNRTMNDAMDFEKNLNNTFLDQLNNARDNKHIFNKKDLANQQLKQLFSDLKVRLDVFIREYMNIMESADYNNGIFLKIKATSELMHLVQFELLFN